MDHVDFDINIIIELTMPIEEINHGFINKLLNLFPFSNATDCNISRKCALCCFVVIFVDCIVLSHTCDM